MASNLPNPPQKIAVPIPQPPQLVDLNINFLDLPHVDAPTIQLPEQPPNPISPPTPREYSLSNYVYIIPNLELESYIKVLGDFEDRFRWGDIKYQILTKYWRAKEELLEKASSKGFYSLDGIIQSKLYQLTIDERNELYREKLKFYEEAVSKYARNILRALEVIEEYANLEIGFKNLNDPYEVMKLNTELLSSNFKARADIIQAYVNQLKTQFEIENNVIFARSQQNELTISNLEKSQAVLEDLIIRTRKNQADVARQAVESERQEGIIISQLLEAELVNVEAEMFRARSEYANVLAKARTGEFEIALTSAKSNLEMLQLYKERLELAKLQVQADYLKEDIKIIQKRGSYEIEEIKSSLNREKIDLFQKEFSLSKESLEAELDRIVSHMAKAFSQASLKKEYESIKLIEKEYSDSISNIINSARISALNANKAEKVRLLTSARAAMDNAAMSATAADLIQAIKRAASIEAKLIHVLGS